MRMVSRRALLEAALRERRSLALETVGQRAEVHAKELCPVDTGQLRDSIGHAAEEDSACVGTDVEYAPFVELGTSRTPAQPFLQPALENRRAEYRLLAERILSGE